MSKRADILLVDACVLMDYQQSDFSIFELVNQYVATVHVLTTTLTEVDGLEVADCERYGITVVEPTLNQVVRATE